MPLLSFSKFCCLSFLSLVAQLEVSHSTIENSAPYDKENLSDKKVFSSFIDKLTNTMEKNIVSIDYEIHMTNYPQVGKKKSIESLVNDLNSIKNVIADNSIGLSCQWLSCQDNNLEAFWAVYTNIDNFSENYQNESLGIKIERRSSNINLRKFLEANSIYIKDLF
jgi:hypothetical protein